jgi:pyruvate/2-oxoglutarate dehydrogenase complex dihydrolipoamide acyltransferase (E2) component
MSFGRRMQNVDYLGKIKATPWRKIAMGLWAAPNDPSIYCSMQIDAREMLEKISRAKEAKRPSSATAIVVEASAKALAENSGLNVVMRLGSLYQRKDINIFVHLLPDATRDDLTGFVIRNADLKRNDEIALEISKEIEAVRKNGVDRLEATKDQLGGIPGILLYPLFKVISFFLYSFNLLIPGLGLEKDSFGSISVSTVGGFTNYDGFSPLDSYARCPIVMVIGAIRDEVKVIAGEMKICPILPLGLTFDHRIVDGIGCAKFMESLNRHLLQSAEGSSQALHAVRIHKN